MVCTRVYRREWRYWSYAQVAGATADASNGPHHPLRSHRIINAGAGRVPPVVDMNDNPGSPIPDRDGLSRALAGCGMAVEAMEASVTGLHRNGGIWEGTFCLCDPPPSDTGAAAHAR